jgi:hypothetical protein
VSPGTARLTLHEGANNGCRTKNRR